MDERYTQILDDETKENAVHLGDGAYAVFDGYSVEIFASNGIYKTPSVFLEEGAIEKLYKMTF